jgi:hypothetical protein
MLGEAVFQRLVERAPFCAMFRATAENLLAAPFLDDLFEQTAQVQWTKELTFSALADLLARVVLRARPSVCAAHRLDGPFPVSLTAVYGKLQNVEPQVGEALVAQTARRAAGVLAQWPAALRPDPIAGLHLVTADGNYLAGTEHRPGPLRGSGAAALPGMAVVRRDDRTGLLTHAALREDAYTNERALLGVVLSWLLARQLLLGDRNFCTLDFLAGLEGQQNYYLIRHHQQVPLEGLGPAEPAGRTDTGAVYEQRVRRGDGRACRLVLIRLNQPTRDGETEVRLLSNVPAGSANAKTLADLYLRRWTVEASFQELTEVLRCAVDTLAYPKAALFGFALALVAYDLLAVLKGALASVHGQEAVEQGLSGYYVAQEVASTYAGMEALLPAGAWEPFAALSAAALAAWLQGVARQVEWQKYRKSKRGPRKPPAIHRTQRGSHRSTDRVLQNRRTT